MKWASIAGLLGAAGLWSRLAPFEVLVRFLVTASALVLMFQGFQTRYYSVAADLLDVGPSGPTRSPMFVYFPFLVFSDLVVPSPRDVHERYWDHWDQR